MTTYIIFNTTALFIVLLICIYLVYRAKSKEHDYNLLSSNDRTQKNKLDWVFKALLITAFTFILISFISPFILTRTPINSDFDYSQTGQIGDTIGGLMNPFIAIAGVIITGLAFYVQYKANLQQRELFLLEQEENKKQLQQQIDNQERQIRIQQFESQFYEMLKIHRDNINEMKINGYDFKENGSLEKYEKITEGRKVFVAMKTEFECLLSYYTGDKSLNSEVFKKCYRLFFFGLDEYARSFPTEKIHIEFLTKIRNMHEHPDLRLIKTNKDRKERLNAMKLYFNYKPFSGHSSRLGHYFRHLYLTVKLVATSDIITDYDERMKYLKILRAQLSNHEQILLFYNWLSGYGDNWENRNHQFFTEYCMIHNLWYTNLFESPYIQKNVDFLRNKDVIERKGNMFEIDDL